MGEGGAFLLLEEYEAARTRDAHVYAEITGFGSASDVERLITPDPTGRPLADAIERALCEAGSRAEQVDYVSGGGSGSLCGDASEGHALQAVFGEDGAAPSASSVTAATGNLGAGGGPANVAVAALSIERQVMPPTLNLKTLDPACTGIDWIADHAREAPVREAVAVARGLEGQNVALALRAV